MSCQIYIKKAISDALSHHKKASPTSDSKLLFYLSALKKQANLVRLQKELQFKKIFCALFLLYLRISFYLFAHFFCCFSALSDAKNVFYSSAQYKEEALFTRFKHR